MTNRDYYYDGNTISDTAIDFAQWCGTYFKLSKGVWIRKSDPFLFRKEGIPKHLMRVYAIHELWQIWLDLDYNDK